MTNPAKDRQAHRPDHALWQLRHGGSRPSGSPRAAHRAESSRPKTAGRHSKIESERSVSGAKASEKCSLLDLAQITATEQLAEAMFRIELGKLRFFSKEEAEGYGLTEWDAVYKELKDVQEARKLSLDRQDFMKRRPIALAYCPSQTSPIDDWRKLLRWNHD